jgi:integrase
VAPATYETLSVLVAASEALAGGRVRPQLQKKTDAVAILLRDRALVLLGFALGRRGSELARVDLEHIEWRPDGLLIKIPYSKTNKSGEPEVIGVPKFVGDPLCPVAALATWVHYAKITAGAVFVTLSPVAGKGGKRIAPLDISRRLEAIAAKAGLPGIWRSHSLRRGVVTSAEAAGVARSRTRLLTGWKSDAMFGVYADHRDKIAQSPLHDLYRR